jgi:uncharacterized protein (TIGR02996 family)
MSRLESFLQAIREEPDDDRPRLEFADWLTEQGDPRGQFIRVQCELARVDDQSLRWKELRRLQRELLGRHGDAWLGLPPGGLGQPNSVGFDRGLLSPTIFFRDLVDEPVLSWWTAHRTWVGKLCLAYVEDECFLELVAGGLLSETTVLDLTCDVDFTDDGLELLPELIQLRELSLTAADMGGLSYTDEGLLHLAGLRHLRKLELECWNAITDAGLDHLARLTWLRELKLCGTELTGPMGRARLSDSLPGVEITF